MLLGVLLYGVAQQQLSSVERTAPAEEMRIALPRMVQLIATAGDRYLAANIATFRALVASIEGLTPDQYRIQAIVQQDAAIFNPAHQDNYFVAAAVLPWNGELDAGQFVLKMATEGRPFDIWPPYQYGFYEWHLRKNPLEAVKWLEVAASRTSDFSMHYSLKDMAARWTSTHEDLGLAIRLIRAMAESTNEKAFRKYLLLRVQRLEGLLMLREATARYGESFGKMPTRLEQLVTAKLIDAIPDDPFGIGYALNPEGEPVFRNTLKRAAKPNQSSAR